MKYNNMRSCLAPVSLLALVSSKCFSKASPLDFHHVPNTTNSAPGVSLIMPAERNPHNATLMTFPNFESIGDWTLTVLARTDIAAIANTISRFEPVSLYSRPEHSNDAQAYLGNSTVPTGDHGVELKEANVDQLWIRDYGPIFVKQANKSHTTHSEHVGDAALDFNFNFWGNKYSWQPERSFVKTYIPRDFPSAQLQQSTIVTEGGALEIDGEGTLLATESSIINDNRNINKTKEQIESELKSKLGVERFIWLQGLKGYDVTDDHTDAFARFVKPGGVVISQPPDNAPANVTARYEQALQALNNTACGKGGIVDVYHVQEPDQTALGYPDVEQYFKPVTSYVNWYLPNGAVIIPSFGDETTDGEAKALFEHLFEEREVVQVGLKALPVIGGGIHCSTQQVPA